MTRLIPLLLAVAPFAALATDTTTAPSWAEEIVEAFDAVDPDGGWDLTPIPPTPAAAKTKADILIESLGAAPSASWRGDITLKRGIMLATSPDGTQGLVLPARVMVCGTAGCDLLDPPAALPTESAGCAFPFCGGLAFAEASPAWVVVDIGEAKDGSELWIPRSILVAFDTALIGVEPDEID